MNEKDDKFLAHLERKDKKRDSGFSLGSMLGQILHVPKPEKKDEKDQKDQKHKKGQKQRYKLIRYKNGKKVIE